MCWFGPTTSLPTGSSRRSIRLIQSSLPSRSSRRPSSGNLIAFAFVLELNGETGEVPSRADAPGGNDMKIRLAALAALCLGLVVWAIPASAGGWAVVHLDAVPSQVFAGKPVTLT